MKYFHTIKINFKGGIISPGELMDILNAASQWGVKQVSFGMRQQLLIDVESGLADKLSENLDALDIIYEVDKDDYPNIVSSYPAEEIFINNTWLGEGVYKDILDGLNHNSKLKINISDSNQSFTPLLTGNINWVASSDVPHFWHLFIRFPKTNNVFEWDEMVYTNDVSSLSKEIESIIYKSPHQFIDKEIVNSDELFSHIRTDQFITKPIKGKMALPDFNLPYYEGLNRHNDKYWLGIYQRSEMFSITFLKDLCKLCLDTKVGQLCSTPWKSIIIKGIEEKDKQLWGNLLDAHQINMRHAANELNFQVQDNDEAARKLKNYLVQKLNALDARTFGICIGIKTQKKSEIFSSILIRRKPLFKLFGKEIFHVYDILCAKDFNPNERTDTIFISNISRLHLVSELQKAVLWFYKTRNKKDIASAIKKEIRQKVNPEKVTFIYQCQQCFSVYDDRYGDPDNNIDPGVDFKNLTDAYCCPICEAPKSEFKRVAADALMEH